MQPAEPDSIAVGTQAADHLAPPHSETVTVWMGGCLAGPREPRWVNNWACCTEFHRTLKAELGQGSYPLARERPNLSAPHTRHAHLPQQTPGQVWACCAVHSGHWRPTRSGRERGSPSGLRLDPEILRGDQAAGLQACQGSSLGSLVRSRPWSSSPRGPFSCETEATSPVRNRRKSWAEGQSQGPRVPAGGYGTWHWGSYHRQMPEPPPDDRDLILQLRLGVTQSPSKKSHFSFVFFPRPLKLTLR